MLFIVNEKSNKTNGNTRSKVTRNGAVVSEKKRERELLHFFKHHNLSDCEPEQWESY